MKINLETAAQRLLEADDILILSHRRPDGDTIGTAFGLYYALKQLGKRARIECADPFPEKFSYFYTNYVEEAFEPQFIVCVDIATAMLLGPLKEVYGHRADLCIDHHKSNDFFAKETLLDATAPAAAELMTLVLQEMKITWEPLMADALFTGITTDTGGLRFESVTARTYRVSADLIDGGARNGFINQMTFENVSRGRKAVEALAINSIEYFLDGRCAVLYLPAEMKEKYDVLEEELDGLSSLPRTIEGVTISVTIRDLDDGRYRISLRTNNPYDASHICAKFDGGGHRNAAGCTMEGTLEDVKKRLLDVVAEELK